jgi:hypothetical protein
LTENRKFLDTTRKHIDAAVAGLIMLTSPFSESDSTQMNTKAITILLIACAQLFSCKDDGTGPGGDESRSFSVKISVTNPSGSPVRGLNVSIWNRLTGLSLPKGAPGNSLPDGVNATSTIGFSVAIGANVDVSAFDLDGKPVTNLFRRDSAAAGQYQVNFQIYGQGGTRVFKIRYFARVPSAGSLLFADSVYAVLWQFDYTQSTIGTTADDGTFQTRDSLLFPNVLGLPPLVETSATDPTPLGVFRLSDTVTVVLWDTAAHKAQAFTSVVMKGMNNISLNWAPAANPQPAALVGPRPKATLPRVTRIQSKAPPQWGLQQNWPNPFN